MILTNNCTTQSNQPAFQAAFKTNIPVKDLKRLANIQDLFAKKTQHYAKDTLTLTMSKDPLFKDYSVVTTSVDRLGVDDYKYSHIFESLDDLMETFTDNQIVKKLVNYFKMLKKEEAFDISVDSVNKTLKHLNAVKLKNEYVSANCQKSGNVAMETRYKALAENVQKKIDSVMLQHEKDKSKIIDDMRKIGENESSLNYVPEYYASPDFK